MLLYIERVLLCENSKYTTRPNTRYNLKSFGRASSFDSIRILLRANFKSETTRKVFFWQNKKRTSPSDAWYQRIKNKNKVRYGKEYSLAIPRDYWNQAGFIRDGVRESMSRKFTMSRKFQITLRSSLFFWYFVQKHKTNYFKTSLIQIPGIDTGRAKWFWKDRT